MFIRCRPYSRTKTIVTICESKRYGKKVIQNVVKYLGIAQDESHLKSMKALARSEIKRIEKDRNKTSEPKQPSPSNFTNAENLIEQARFIEGFHDIFAPVFNELKLSDVFSEIRINQLRDLVIARIAEPCSKLRTSEILKRDYNKPFSENQIYKLMDLVFKQENHIKLKIFEATKSRCQNQVVDVLFFDVTTLYFESQKSDDLKKNGYSKDHKIGEVQVVLALATTSEGLPVGYGLFPGNTAEVKTLLDCIDTWKKDLKIENVVVVADRAMMSEKNLENLEKCNFKYIIAAKLKSLPKSLKSEILNRSNEFEGNFDSEKIRLQELSYNNRRLVVSFSESRAKKDRSDRDRLISKVKSKLNDDGESETQKFVTNKGFLKYTEETQLGKVKFDESKIKEDSKWDGLHGIITNDTEAKAVDLLNCYRRLWVIEESFRINKHSLEMRPVFHFKPERIKAHILICYLAFALTRYVQQKVSLSESRLSVEKIRDALSSVEASILKDQKTNQMYKLSSKLSCEANMIYRGMGLIRSQNFTKL